MLELTFLVTLHPPKYLRWLLKTFLNLGGRVERREIEDITEAIEQYSANIIVNCTGFGSFNLKDVKDTNLFALRGQTILVRAPHIKVSINIKIQNN